MQQNFNVRRANNRGNFRGRGNNRGRGGRHSKNQFGETDPYDMTNLRESSDTGRTT